MKRVLILLGVVVFFIGALFILWKVLNRPANNTSLEIPQTDRPEAVPSDAVWVGGIDGGDWIQCESKGDGIYNCQIFSTQGAIISSGEYCSKSEATQINLSYRMYDGEVIYLEEGDLTPIGEHVYYYGDSEEDKKVVSYTENTCLQQE